MIEGYDTFGPGNLVHLPRNAEVIMAEINGNQEITSRLEITLLIKILLKYM